MQSSEKGGVDVLVVGVDSISTQNMFCRGFAVGKPQKCFVGAGSSCPKIKLIGVSLVDAQS